MAVNPERQQHGRARGITSGTPNPKWWTDDYTSGWDKVREAFRRDWEQTKSDLSFKKAGTDLDQDVPDTVKQATGKEAIPPGNVPNPDVKREVAFERIEPAFRYGYGARRFYKDAPAWSDDVESRLRAEWAGLGSSIDWETGRPYIRKGFEYRV